MTSGRFVVDNSVVMAWCFRDERDGYALAALEALEVRAAVVPAVWPLEVGNVLAVAERTKRLAKAHSVRFLALLSALPITVIQETPAQMLTTILGLARQQSLSTYDASYLHLAMSLDIPLATTDAALVRAAAKTGVPIFQP